MIRNRHKQNPDCYLLIGDLVDRLLRGTALLMRQAGIEPFLANMLYLMRRSARDWQQNT